MSPWECLWAWKISPHTPLASHAHAGGRGRCGTAVWDPTLPTLPTPSVSLDHGARS